MIAKPKAAQSLTGRQPTGQKLPQPLGGRALQTGGQQDPGLLIAGRGEGGGIEADPVQRNMRRTGQRQAVAMQDKAASGSGSQGSDWHQKGPWFESGHGSKSPPLSTTNANDNFYHLNL